MISIRIFNSAIFALIYIAVFFVVLTVHFNDNASSIGIIFSVITFLFGIFVSFSISDRHNRLNKIRELDSVERASMETIFEFSSLFGSKIQKNISDCIDKYLVSVFDHQIWEYGETEKELVELSKCVRSINPKNNARHSETFKIMLADLSAIGNSREQTVPLINDKLSFYEKFAFIILAGILVFSTLFINSEPFVSFMLALLDLIVVTLLWFLHKLDNLEWKYEAMIFEPYQHTFESIGKLRYYPETLIASGKVKNHRGKTYRLAIYPNYPSIEGKKIKIVKPKNARK